MLFPASYWRSYEHRVKSLPSFMKAVKRISAYEQKTESKFVWRGVANAAHTPLPLDLRSKVALEQDRARNEADAATLWVPGSQ